MQLTILKKQILHFIKEINFYINYNFAYNNFVINMVLYYLL